MRNVLEGRLLMRNAAIWKAYNQNLEGKEAFASRVNLASMTWQMLHLAFPFFFRGIWA